MTLGVLDIILLISFIPALVWGIRKGLTDQIIGIISIILGSYLAFRFSSSLSDSLSPTFPGTDLRLLRILSFAIIFTIVLLVLCFVGKLINKLIRITTLGWLNRVLGFLFAIFTSALFVGLAMSVITGINDKIGLINQSVFDNSPVYDAISNFSGKVFPYLKEFFSHNA